jgi:predicted XRE-type DNA-binding protein
MNLHAPETATIQALRSDVALQLSRHVRGLGMSQVEAATRLGLPQPTLSKIINGRVSDISLELLIRVAVRAGLPMTLLTGHAPQEAGAFRTALRSNPGRTFRSALAEAAQQSLNRSVASLLPSQRLEAFLEHSQLLGALHQAGRAAEARRVHSERLET